MRIFAEPTPLGARGDGPSLLAVPVVQDGSPLPSWLEELDRTRFGGSLAAAMAAGDFAGKEGDTLLLYGGGGATALESLLAVGMGKEPAGAEELRRFAGRAVRAAEGRRRKSLTLLVNPAGIAIPLPEALEAVAQGSCMAGWRFRECRSGSAEDGGEAPGSVEAVGIGVADEGIAGGTTDAVSSAGTGPEERAAAIRRGEIVGRSVNFARTLQSRPGNIATPSHLAAAAESMAEGLPLEVTVLGPEALRAQRMHALLAVARGSEEEPRLIVIEYRGGEAGAAPLALVGKGLTFDAGGISIKPAAGMDEMKFDMSGGAAVIATMQAIAELELPVNVVAIVPSSENLLGGAAMKPGDILTTRAGKTVEVLNTDAEGRLILSDALDYALSFAPKAIVDCATLTGACVIALGHQVSAVLGSDDDLVAELREAGDRSGERCWPLPMHREYRKQLDSTVADLQNIGGRAAGTITAAWFLREFTGEVPWAHLDIAGTAYGDSPLPYQRKGGFGVPVRLLIEWVRSRAQAG